MVPCLMTMGLIPSVCQHQGTLPFSGCPLAGLSNPTEYIQFDQDTLDKIAADQLKIASSTLMREALMHCSPTQLDLLSPAAVFRSRVRFRIRSKFRFFLSLLTWSLSLMGKPESTKLIRHTSHTSWFSSLSPQTPSQMPNPHLTSVGPGLCQFILRAFHS